MMKSLFGGKKKQENKQAVIQENSTPAAANTAQAAFGDTDDAELIAVIMAAINASMGSQSNLVISRITRVGDSTPVWGQIGRHEQMLNRF